MFIRKTILVVLTLAALGACGADDDRGGLSADEERRLDDAAERLDAAQPDPSPAGNEARAAEGS